MSMNALLLCYTDSRSFLRAHPQLYSEIYSALRCVFLATRSADEA